MAQKQKPAHEMRLGHIRVTIWPIRTRAMPRRPEQTILPMSYEPSQFLVGETILQSLSGYFRKVIRRNWRRVRFTCSILKTHVECGGMPSKFTVNLWPFPATA